MNIKKSYKDLNGQYHRDGGPAIIFVDGTLEWWKHGDLHREDGPAKEFPDGTLEWWINGKLHRDDGPAAINYEGELVSEWYQNGKLHRDDGPAVTYKDGEEWYQNGELHREDGPAVTTNGQKLWCIKRWYKDGNRHRDGDRPAMIMANGIFAWYKNNISYKPNWQDHHFKYASNVALGLKSIDVPVLILVEIVSKLVYKEGLTMHQAWEIFRLIKRIK